MTVAPLIVWFIAAITVLAAARPVTPKRLTTFSRLNGISVTVDNAGQVIGQVTILRRGRLACVVASVPVAVLTDDLFYLVLGWFAFSVLRPAEPAVRTEVYRRACLAAFGAAVLATCCLLADQGITPAFLAHAVIVAAAAFRAARNAAFREVCLGASAIALSGAFLVPGVPLPSERPAYTPARSFPEPRTATFEKAEGLKRPTCAWVDEVDAPCRYWQLNGSPFPQAAPYVIGRNGMPEAAPFARSPDRKAAVYLHRTSRRMVYQDAGGTRTLTGPLSDDDVPAVTFGNQNRFFALTQHDTRIFDTDSWTSTPIPAPAAFTTPTRRWPPGLPDPRGL